MYDKIHYKLKKKNWKKNVLPRDFNAYIHSFIFQQICHALCLALETQWWTKTWVPHSNCLLSLGRADPSQCWEDPLEQEMAMHFITLAWKLSWTEESGGLQSKGSQRVRYDQVTENASLGKVDNIYTFAGKFQGVVWIHGLNIPDHSGEYGKFPQKIHIQGDIWNLHED